MLTILAAVFVFGVLVTVHEFGHFITAKLTGMRVDEFAIGFGPKLYQQKDGDTLYSLRAIPLGGYNKIAGMDPDDPPEPGTFKSKPIPSRMLVILAGALMNFLLGFLIVLILTLPQTQGTEPVIQGFADGFPSQGESMLMKGDRILSIDGYRVLLTSDVTTGLSLGTDTSYDIVVQRNGEKKELHDVKLEPAEYDGVQRYGVDFTVKQLTVVDKVKNAVYRSYDYARLVWISLKQLVSGQVGIDQMSGPVGVTDVLVQTAQSSMTSFFLLIAFISINLGVMNLLPLPALDGGRLLFVLIELIARKPVPRKYEGYIHFGGFAILMLLMVYVTWQDILRLLGVA